MSECATNCRDRVNAAEGWVDLGNHLEAHNELEQLPHSERIHPEVLKVRCRIYRQAGKWDYLSILTESCYQARPEEAQFLIEWAWAQYNESRRFPESEMLAYDLAIVLTSLDRMAEARDRLATAFELESEPDKLKLRALEDAGGKRCGLPRKAERRNQKTRGRPHQSLRKATRPCPRKQRRLIQEGKQCAEDWRDRLSPR